MTSVAVSIILAVDEIAAITGAVAPSVQLRELQTLGFTRARRGLDKKLILERAHYEAVCAGAIVLSPGRLPKAAETLMRSPTPCNTGRPSAAPQPAIAAVPAPIENKKAGGRQQKITLDEWAILNYGRSISKWVLLKWRREGQIYPEPERVWPNWMVEPDAKRNVNGAGYVPLVERIKARGM